MAHQESVPHIPVLAIVGVGLMGGSFAAALRQAGCVTRILGVGRQMATLIRAREAGLIDEIVTAAEAASRADLLMLAVPVGSFGEIFNEIRDSLKSGAVMTDVGSTKAEVVHCARQTLGAQIARFVPGHPIAGGEQVGPEAAKPELYTGCQVVLTPLAENAPSDVERVRAAWQACGAHVLQMGVQDHDQLLASVSHIPHFLAAVYLTQVARSADSARRFALAGPGFRDFTRMTAGSAEMWRDILLSNRRALKEELAEVHTVLTEAEQLLGNGDGAALLAWLEEVAQCRRAWKARP